MYFVLLILINWIMIKSQPGLDILNNNEIVVPFAQLAPEVVE